MPNHCINDITISPLRKMPKDLYGNTPSIEGVMDRIVKRHFIEADEGIKVIDFNTVIKMPSVIPNDNIKCGAVVCLMFGRFPTEQQIDMIVEAGADNWYNWNVKFWGTKWNAYSPSIFELSELHIHSRFMTAWSPPTPVLQRLTMLYPVEIELRCIDEGAGFAGTILFGMDMMNQSKMDWGGSKETISAYGKELWGFDPHEENEEITQPLIL